MDKTMDNVRSNIADLLFERGAIQFGSFKLKLHEKNPDAPLSPFYINLRTPDNPKPGPLSIVDCDEIAAIMSYAIPPKLRGAYMVGIPNAGVPLVYTRFPASQILHLRKITKADGTREIIAESSFESYLGKGIVLWDDLVTKANTKMEAIRALTKVRACIEGIVVLIDRMQGGKVELERLGYPVWTVFSIVELFVYAKTRGKITMDTYNQCMNYLKG